MSAHESMEHAEHADHASASNKSIALLIAVIALCLALSETFGKAAQTDSISENVAAANLWAFFQAKSIRQTTLKTAAEQLQVQADLTADPAAKAAFAKRIEGWQGTVARYEDEPSTGEGRKQLVERAKQAEAKRDLSLAKYHHFELASAAFQIAIVLASASIITSMIVLAWISGGLLLVGIGMTAIGIFAPHAVHLM
ncbi:MAG TPA: DUF4337 domain-containing protein [Xanthobacteraceae bacterium]|nr:DUF4337 domain-containing protein [Xanthobacteraceae bacterium]HWW49282.1 DUF4337 domain-containing protein [Xanthobacteraceae bacterium]